MIFFCGIYRRVQIFWNAKMKSGGFVIDFFFFGILFLWQFPVPLVKDCLHSAFYVLYL